MNQNDIEARLRKKILDMHQNETSSDLSASNLSGPQLNLHLSMHLVVEKQLATGEPAFVGTIVRALMEGHDLSRHEAIHRTFDAVSSVVLRSIETGQYDEAAYEDSLELLLADSA